MLLFSLILFGILALVISAILGIPVAMAASRIVRKKDLEHKQLIIVSATITPALFIGLEVVLGLIGSVYISEKKGVDMGFGDYWEAPLTDSYYLSAVDMPETATIGRRVDDLIYDGPRVKHLWVTEDSIVAACTSVKGYSLYAFHLPDDAVDTLLNKADSLQYAEALQRRNLDPETALTPDKYFIRAQKEAHKIEEPVRHATVVVILLAFWVILLRLTQKKRR